MSAPSIQWPAQTDFWHGIMVTLIVIWSLLLVLIIFNAYSYLYKLMKYKFAPMVMVYLGNSALACLVIAYFSERLNDNSRVMRQESAWVYFDSNLRLACEIVVLGFIGLLVELRLMLIAIYESSENQIAHIKQRRSYQDQQTSNQTQLNDYGANGTLETDSTIMMEFEGVNQSKTRDESLIVLSPALTSRKQSVEKNQMSIVQEQNAKTRKLELISIIGCIIMFLFYNMLPIIIGTKIKKHNIMTNQEFYQNDEIMTAWTTYLLINSLIQVIISFFLSLATWQIVKTMKRFFGEQFLKKTSALLFVTITILATSFLGLINDSVATIIQVLSNDADGETEGMAVMCLIIWIPSFTINILHFRNIRMQKDAETRNPKNQLHGNTFFEDKGQLRVQDYSQLHSGPLDTISDEGQIDGVDSTSKNRSSILEQRISTSRPSSCPNDEDKMLTPGASERQYERQQQLYLLQNQRGKSMGTNSSVNTGFQGVRRGQYSESFSTFSKGMLIPDHILLRRQALICEQRLETPQVSEEVISNSHQMSFQSYMPLDQTHDISVEEFQDQKQTPEGYGRHSQQSPRQSNNVLQLTAKNPSVHSNFLQSGDSLKIAQNIVHRHTGVATVAQSKTNDTPSNQRTLTQNSASVIDGTIPSSLNKSQLTEDPYVAISDEKFNV